MKALLLLCGILAACMLNAQEKPEQYFVIKVQGEIQRLKTGNLLITGDEITSNEGLLFRTDYSRAAVISPARGRFILTSSGKRDAENRGNFLPPMNNLSSRAVTASSTNDILEYFTGDVLFLGADTINFDGSRLNFDKDNYFVISFDAGGTEQKVILNASSGIIPVDREKIFGNMHPKTARIAFNSSRSRSQSMEFVPVFPDNQTLLKEVKLLIANSSKMNRIDIVGDITSYLNDFYGKISQGSVDTWLKQNNII